MTENSSHTGFGTFLLTRLLRGATTSGPFCGDGKHDFYSHASCEARRAQFPIFGVPQYFYSHASCEARRIARQYYDEHKDISTHTPLARRDVFTPATVTSPFDFYSHASCEARPATTIAAELGSFDFYSHASCEARPRYKLSIGAVTNFYSHASCEARLPPEFTPLINRKEFLLTRLLRGATTYSITLSLSLTISTHTPLARRDITLVVNKPIINKFLLTRLLRGATRAEPYHISHILISTHTPLARRDYTGRK